MEEVTYQGWRIEPQSRCLPKGGFVGKVRVRRDGQEASATRLLYLRGRWDTEEEALCRAVEAGRSLIDAGLARSVGATDIE